MRLKIITSLSVFIVITFACNKDDAVGVNQATCLPYQVLDAGGNAYAEFSYTDWGDPHSITRKETGTGEYEYVFYYNSQKQLTALREGIFNDNDTGTAAYWKYVYENNRIVADTFFSGASLEDPVNEEYYIEHYLYDSLDRIKQVSMLSSLDVNFRDTIEFSYPETNSTNNRHSIFAGNKVLMFVNRDYNRINPGVVKYNEQGYPIEFSLWLNGWQLQGYSFQSLSIQYLNYQCR